VLKKKIFVNTLFNVSSQLLTFGFGIPLARILFPDDFGVYSISFLIIGVTGLLVLSGFFVALIQIKEVDERHFGSVFCVNLFLGFIFALVIFFNTRAIADFFKMPLLRLLLPWHIIVLFIMPVRKVCGSKLGRDLKFKEFGIGIFFSKIVNGTSAILFSYFGFGALSLVFGHILEILTETLFYLYFKGKTTYKFFLSLNFGALKQLSHVGFGITLQNIFDYISKNIDYFLLGKMTSATALGFYTRAYKLMNLPVRQVSRNISVVLLSAFSRIQEKNDELAHKFLKATQTTSLVAFPAFLVGYIYLPAMIFFVYGEKWMPVVAPLRILIFAGAVKSVSMYIGDVLKAKGIVYRELFVAMASALILAVCGYFAIARAGVIGISLVVFFVSLLTWLAMAAILLSVLKLSAIKYLKIFIPSFLICFVIFLWNMFLKNTISCHWHEMHSALLGIISSAVLYIILIFTIKDYCLIKSEIENVQKRIFIFKKHTKTK